MTSAAWLTLIFSAKSARVILTLFHIIFVAMSVFGISAMYLNSNYGKGVKWIYEDAYEDSAQFDKQLTEDIDRIFTYVGY